jgi:putative transposase
MTVRRFCERFGIPPSTWYYWRTGHRSGESTRRWPAPAVDLVEELAAEKKDDDRFSPWGHRKIWSLIRADGINVSASTVKRALDRRGLLLPARYHAERRILARARKGVFKQPTPRRNRVWQTDFSEFETTTNGNWMLSGVVDYWAKVCLTCSANVTQSARDVVATIEAAIAEAERLIGHSLKEDCVDRETGEIFPLVIVSDNGPAYKSDLFARFILGHPWISHIRTRYRSPQTNGVIERFFQSIKYEHLYRHEISNGVALNEHCAAYRALYNDIRPHEVLGQHPPIGAYLAAQMTFEQERNLIDSLRDQARSDELPPPLEAPEITPISEESVQKS